MKKFLSKIIIKGPTPVIIFTGIRYSWFKKQMYKIFFGLGFEKYDGDNMFNDNDILGNQKE